MTNPNNPDERQPEGAAAGQERQGQRDPSDLHPGDNPRDAQEEAKTLHPNEDTRTQEERDNLLEKEFEAEGERELDKQERQHRPLTDADDNVKVDLAEDDQDDPEASAPEAAATSTARSEDATTSTPRRQPPPRDYLVSANTLRNLFIASGVFAALVIVVILTLASSTNRARYTPADNTQHQRTLEEATARLSALELNDDGQTARIPIEEAMALLAERGLEEVSTALAEAPAETPPSVPDPQDGVAEAPATEGEAPPAVAEAPAQTETPPAEQPAPEAMAEAPAQEAEAPAETAADASETTTEAAPAGGVPEVLTAGQAAYEANCASCHQANGAGIVGAFPPVAGHAAALYNAEGGRPYLINLLLYGLQGEIQVEGQTYNGVMPAWQQLSDDDIANILNYIVTAWDGNQQLQDFTPFEAAEVAERRTASLSSNDVYALRQQLDLSGQ
jgi:mono/diheme cytochrome c family protein